MNKLNEVTVNADKIKVGKDTFDCNITNKAVVYIARMSESKKDIKIVLDEYTITKNQFGFDIVLISDAIDAVTFNKSSQTTKHIDLLEPLATAGAWASRVNSKTVEKLGKVFIDFAAAIEQSDIVIVHGNEAAINFVRRYVAIMNPSICEQAPVVINRLPEMLIPYIDKLDVVEKVMNETSPANLAYQLENKTFDANINVNVLPLKTLQKCTKAGLRENSIKKLEDYVSCGRGTLEEVEQMFRWCTAIKKLYDKTTGYSASTYSVYHIVDLIQYGFTLTEIMLKISNDLMKQHSITEVTGCDLLDKLADIMAYRKVNNNNDFSMPDNIVIEHENAVKMYDIEYRYVNELFANIAHAFNRSYSDIIDDMAFICPDHIRDFKRYSDRVNQLSVKNLNDFIDGKIMIFAIANEQGKIYDAPIFFFDENGNIQMIHNELNDKQVKAAKELWTRIQNKKGN